MAKREIELNGIQGTEDELNPYKFSFPTFSVCLAVLLGNIPRILQFTIPAN